MDDEKIGTGAEISQPDPRTYPYDTATITEPLLKGGHPYLSDDIEHQHHVGICTAISRVQLRQKQTGKKYSPEFQYLLQKKFYDLAWYEGSSIMVANKVAKQYGFLPAHLWTHTTENDRFLSYEQYSAKLQAIPASEIYRLIDLCVDKIASYRPVNVADQQAIAKAINDSKAGVLCRYDCGSTWWLPSWKPKDINPLRKPIPATSGHAIIMNQFDYTNDLMQVLSNTWGTLWNNHGTADINWNNYKMTECWEDLEAEPEIKYIFTVTLRYLAKGEDVKQLQKKLTSLGFSVGAIDGQFGKKTLAAVISFQKSRNLVADGICGPRTNQVLNLI